MSEDYQDIEQWIQSLTVRSAAEQMRAMQRYNDLLQRVARGDLDDQQVREEYMRFASEESARYIRNLTTLSISYYNALVELNRGFNDRFFQRMMQQAAGEELDDADGAGERQAVELPLAGAVGETVERAFVIENNRLSATEISFVVSEFSDDTGEKTFRPPLQIQPPRFTLEPESEQTVKLQLPLLADLFEPGQRYHSTIVVRGYNDMELQLIVTVDEAEAPAKPAKKPARKKKPAAKKPEAKADTETGAEAEDGAPAASAASEASEASDEGEIAIRPSSGGKTGRKRKSSSKSTSETADDDKAEG